MVPRSKIDLGKELGILQLIQEVIDPRKRILVLDYHDIQIPIVNAHPHRAILLFHKKDRGALG
jgi:ABC-type cobalamin/Fe3+-siderophores transport system ATPase subunit